MYFLGFDIGSSSVKAALVDAATKEVKGVVSAPSVEMPIDAPQKGYAEQDPGLWWKYVCECSQRLMSDFPSARDRVRAIGLAYQMHGLVVLDQEGEVLRPSIIWSDSRAVSTGEEIEKHLDREDFIERHYNLPGNFTFSKLKWLQDNEPDVFEKIDKIMLPGDYIAYRMTGEVRTSMTGLSEGIMWDFRSGEASYDLLKTFEIPVDFLPDEGPSFSVSGYLTDEGLEALGLKKGTEIAVSYRSGDQPNNAWSLNVNEPGVMAGTGGTSAVLYGISEKPVIDYTQRTNTFAHVNYSPEKPLTGTLLNINGAGILYSWIRKNIIGSGSSYGEMEERASGISAGSDGLLFLPFGNGAERMLNNRTVHAHLLNLDLNRHTDDHLVRAGLEGIGFAYAYGYEIMSGLGMEGELLRVGNDNLFQSDIFSNLISSVCDVEIEMREVTGAVGAALGSGVGVGYYGSLDEAMSEGKVVRRITPHSKLSDRYQSVYEKWKTELKNKLENEE